MLAWMRERNRITRGLPASVHVLLQSPAAPELRRAFTEEDSPLSEEDDSFPLQRRSTQVIIPV